MLYKQSKISALRGSVNSQIMLWSMATGHLLSVYILVKSFSIQVLFSVLFIRFTIPNLPNLYSNSQGDHWEGASLKMSESCIEIKELTK